MTELVIKSLLERNKEFDFRKAIVEFVNYKHNKEFIKSAQLSYFHQISQSEKRDIHREVR